MVARRGLPLSFLPEEIIEQVILRVQCSKSIVRCMSVCRSWYALIKSHYFVNMHISHPGHTKYLLCYHEKVPPRDYNGRLYYSLHYDNETFHEYNMLEYPDKAFYVHGCKGLICYNKDNDPKRLCLWNPAIRKLKVLPASPQDHDDCYPSHICIRPFQLWYDRKANDFRILRFIVYLGKTDKATLVEFYSLNTNSWKLITDNAPGTSRIGKHTYVNGVWYWINYADDVHTLFSLDTENWMFRKVRAWATMSTTSNRIIGPVFLTSIDDRYLVIFGYVHLHYLHQKWRWYFSEVYDQSLNQFYQMDFRLLRKIVDGWVLIGVRNNAEFLLQNYLNPKYPIISWNWEARQIKHFVPVCSHRLDHVFPYTESLALLNDADAITI